MATLPLLTQPTHPDGSHAVRAPGGYEWWYFDAEDPTCDVQFVGILMDGFPFHPGYLRRHARYLRRPTKVPPAFPQDYPCAYLAVYERGKLAAQFMSQYPAGSLHASSSEPRVTLGTNRLAPTESCTANGLELKLEGAPWVLTGRGPRTFREHKLAATISLRPKLAHKPTERTFLSRQMTGADHRWILANPLCDFTATIHQTGPTARTWQLFGHAYHDHNFGTAPIGPGLRHWIWGRVLTDDAVHTFHYALPRDRSLPPESHLIIQTPASVDQIELPPNIDFSRRTPLGLAYPASINFGNHLTLKTPRVIDNTPFYLRVQYQAQANGRPGIALCEVAHPHRLRWPILGRMIEMSIDRRLEGTIEA